MSSTSGVKCKVPNLLEASYMRTLHLESEKYVAGLLLGLSSSNLSAYDDKRQSNERGKKYRSLWSCHKQLCI